VYRHDNDHAALALKIARPGAATGKVPVGKRPGFVSSPPDIAINKVWQLRDQGLHQVKSADAYPYQ
jgi:hypothetical protein